jgi:hypothetical protein
MKKTLLLATVLMTAIFDVSAQSGSMGGPGMSVTKFFGSNNAFSAACDIIVTNADGAQVMSGTMKYAMLGDKVRTEMDMAQMTNSQMPPDAAESMKKMGMAHAISIVRPDQKLLYVIYPDLKDYARMPAPPAANAGTNKEPEIELTKLGEETIDGHPCVKNKAVVTGDDGQSHGATLWNATDLKDFPVQIQSSERDITVTMHFKDIQLATPNASLFDPPAGFTGYDGMQQMMMAVMQKSLKSAPASGPPPQ